MLKISNLTLSVQRVTATRVLLPFETILLEDDFDVDELDVQRFTASHYLFIEKLAQKGVR